jgi:hypothetical protein
MRTTPSPLRGETPATPPEPTLLVTSEKGRAGLIRWAQRALREGEALVCVKDLVGVRRAMRTQPADPSARLVATEAPTLLRGGLTSLVSYYVAPIGSLDAVETHYEEGEETHRYEVILRVACVGRGERREVHAAA